MKNRITSSVPVDKLLAGLLLAYPSIIYKYHEHDSMLENKTEDELNEQEKQEAWDDYIKENESQPTLATNNQTLAEVRQNVSKYSIFSMFYSILLIHCTALAIQRVNNRYISFISIYNAFI